MDDITRNSNCRFVYRSL